MMYVSNLVYKQGKQGISMAAEMHWFTYITKAIIGLLETTDFMFI